MPSAGIREIKTHLKTIENIHKITKAMEAVAASRMRRAQKQAFQSRPFIQRALEILYNLSRGGLEKEKHFLLAGKKETKNSAILFVTPDRGLCGPLIGGLLRTALSQKIKAEKQGKKVKFFVIGKKGQNFLRRAGAELVAAFPDKEKWTETDAGAVSHSLIRAFQTNEIDEVRLIYANFISPLKQTAVVRILLPLTEENLRNLVETQTKIFTDAAETPRLYKIEPEPKILIDKLIPYLLKMGVYYLLLEGKASEHSARMLAMQNARRNAEEMLEDLTLTYNETRQSAITKQLAEICGGMA